MKSLTEEMKEVTLLGSNTFRLQSSIALLILAASFRMYTTSVVLLLATVWYAQKVFGDSE